MPKSVTTVNLDFDEKMEFIQKFGKAELSAFLRQAIHEKLKEKNREALISLSAIPSILINTKGKVVNQSLDGWIQYARTVGGLEPLIEIFPKVQTLYKLTNGRIKGMQTIRRR